MFGPRSFALLKEILKDSWLEFKQKAEQTLSLSLSDSTIKEVERFIECGEPACGFVRIKCSSCTHEHLVPFSCKTRGFCPSCYSKRLLDTQNKFDELALFEIPIRQWVFTLPVPIRKVVIARKELLKSISGIVQEELISYIKNKAVEELSVNKEGVHAGTIVFIHRFGSSINANPHLHIMLPEGVYIKKSTGRLKFYKVSSPAEKDISNILESIYNKCIILLEKKKIIEPYIDSSGNNSHTLLEFCENGTAEEKLSFASASYDIVTGPNSGKKLKFCGGWSSYSFIDPQEEVPIFVSPLCYSMQGFSLHANVKVHNKEGVERLLGYMARPPVCEERLKINTDGSIYYKFKTPWSNGTDGILFESGVEFIEKLVSIIPPKYQHNIKYYGCFAPASWVRKELKAQNNSKIESKRVKLGDKNSKWAEGIKRVFKRDLSVCPKCSANMVIIAVCISYETVQAILNYFKVPNRPPTFTPPRKKMEANANELIYEYY